jgi:uncharacterized protein (DUF924 family)
LIADYHRACQAVDKGVPVDPVEEARLHQETGTIRAMTNNNPSARSSSETGPSPAAVLDFWLGDGVELGWPTQDFGKKWFSGGAALDADIKTRFGELVTEALGGDLQDWEHEPLSLLALIIVLDQFTRNVFRGKGQAFQGDARTRELVLDALAKNWDQQLPLAGRIFLYMPLMHAEVLALQQECVRRFRQLKEDAPPGLKTNFQSNEDFAAKHRDIIARFGRFPHRNAALGRQSTPEEEVFLRDGPKFGQ